MSMWADIDKGTSAHHVGYRAPFKSIAWDEFGDDINGDLNNNGSNQQVSTSSTRNMTTYRLCRPRIDEAAWNDVNRSKEERDGYAPHRELGVIHLRGRSRLVYLHSLHVASAQTYLYQSDDHCGKSGECCTVPP